MARIKTKDLKNTFLFRIYDEEENCLLKKAIDKNKDKFDSLNDCIKYFVIVGAKKVLEDNLIDNSLNFSEIKEYMKKINDNLTLLKERQYSYYIDNNGEILTTQSLQHLIVNILVKLSEINLDNYSFDWKYFSRNEEEIDSLKIKHKLGLMNVKNT